MDPFNSRAERLAIRRFVVGVALVLALMMSARARAAEVPADASVTSGAGNFEAKPLGEAWRN